MSAKQGQQQRRTGSGNGGGHDASTCAPRSARSSSSPAAAPSLHLVLAGVALWSDRRRRGVRGHEPRRRRAPRRPRLPRPRAADVTCRSPQVNDGKAHFYTYDAGGTTVKYFVLAEQGRQGPRRPRRLRGVLPAEEGLPPGRATRWCATTAACRFPVDKINEVRAAATRPRRAHPRGRAPGAEPPTCRPASSTSMIRPETLVTLATVLNTEGSTVESSVTSP